MLIRGGIYRFTLCFSNLRLAKWRGDVFLTHFTIYSYVSASTSLWRRFVNQVSSDQVPGDPPEGSGQPSAAASSGDCKAQNEAALKIQKWIKNALDGRKNRADKSQRDSRV